MAQASGSRAASSARPEELRVWLAMLTVYLVWGSTYLAIRIVVADLPPLVTAGTRFLIAGSIVAVVLTLRSGPGRLRVDRRQLAGAMLVGAALLLGGNGLVVLAEQTVPSAMTALIIASDPLLIVLLRRLARERIPGSTLVGVLVGFVGVAILVVPAWTGAGADPLGLALLLVASLSWAVGSFISSRTTMPRDPFVSTSYQMLTGGVLMLAVGLLAGEPYDPLSWPSSTDAFVAWLYLIFFGSLAAFTAYTWVLQHAPISRVATTAYVNPVIALILGVIILQEVVTLSMLIGGALIVASVALTVRNESLQSTPDVAPLRATPVDEVA